MLRRCPANPSAILPAVKEKSDIAGSLSVSIVGAGNLGTALALTLPLAGYEVAFVVARAKAAPRPGAKALAGKAKVRFVELGKRPLDTGLVSIAVPDDSIAQVASRLASTQGWKGRIVFHSSGALTSDAAPLLCGQRAREWHPFTL